ncbi:hypothetical protein [Halogeometricum luteum]|uniref:Uncharacterized protein n=1 Tax=Halogeometricum luteum TaxID=2950537 RepID=A0ABU2G780_9EURY|nr:hypothetical protein [Halogeometricum sp. S3BR5-2]MDS0296651.1 hypothetical protein [Halogeometricum sp. S3BR5-2]
MRMLIIVLGDIQELLLGDRGMPRPRSRTLARSGDVHGASRGEVGKRSLPMIETLSPFG